MPEVRISLELAIIVQMKLPTNSENANWYAVAGLCPLKGGCFSLFTII